MDCPLQFALSVFFHVDIPIHFPYIPIFTFLLHFFTIALQKIFCCWDITLHSQKCSMTPRQWKLKIKRISFSDYRNPTCEYICTCTTHLLCWQKSGELEIQKMWGVISCCSLTLAGNKVPLIFYVLWYGIFGHVRSAVLAMSPPSFLCSSGLAEYDTKKFLIQNKYYITTTKT